jgi:hypothetical protein
MRRNYVIGVLVLLLIIAGISYGVHKHNQSKNTSTNPNLSVTVQNQTQNSDGTKVTAHPKDTLVYTLSAENPTDKVISGYVMEVGIGGATNNATLVDAQGANYSSGNNSLIWTPLDIPANGSIAKQFTLRVKDSLPANTADRVIKITFNNELTTNTAPSSVAVNPPSRPGLVGSGTSYTAPKTGIPGWISFYLALFVTFGILLFRVARKIGRPMKE